MDQPHTTPLAVLLVFFIFLSHLLPKSTTGSIPLGLGTLAYPTGSLKARAGFFPADNTVILASEARHCLIVPKDPYTDIGDSEQPGGTTTYCTSQARISDMQGTLPDDFWTDVPFHRGRGVNGGRYAQLTGCIDSSSLDRLNEDDEGGQYDSSGGKQGTGNPVGSVCKGYNHYIELIEPSASRACVRCCEDEDDCPLGMDTEGCPVVIPGEYSGCE